MGRAKNKHRIQTKRPSKKRNKNKAESEKSTQEQLVNLKSKYESYFNWSSIHFSPDDAGEVAAVLHNIFSGGHVEERLRFDGIEMLAGKGAEVYMLYLAMKADEAKQALAEAQEFIRICSDQKYVEEGYLVGFRYVLAGLESYMKADEVRPDPNVAGNSNSGEVEVKQLEIWKGAMKFDELDKKGKAGVFGMKHYFEKELWIKPNEQVALLTQIIELDKENHEWHLCLNYVLRLQRSKKRYENRDNYCPNFDPESKAMLEAMRLAPTHPNCLLGYCVLLAEMATAKKQWKLPLTLGSQSFESAEDVGCFVKSTLKDVLTKSPHNITISLTIAEVFSKLLPRTYLDQDYAKHCIKKALECNPKSSKANHRMTMYFLRIDRSVVSAEKYCTIAFKEDGRNFPAFCELVQILLSNPGKNSEKLDVLFQAERNKRATDIDLAHKSVQIEYFYALFLLMTKKDELDGVEKLVECEKIEKGFCNFKNLGYQINRYRWKELSYDALVRAIRRAEKAATTGVEDFANNRELLGTFHDRAISAKAENRKFESAKLRRKEQENEIEMVVTTGFMPQLCYTDVRHRDKDNKSSLPSLSAGDK